LQTSKDEPQRCQRDAASCSHDRSAWCVANLYLLDDGVTSVEQDFCAELAQIYAESIGWIPLDEGVYLHVGSDDAVIQVVGIAKVEMAVGNVLWLLRVVTFQTTNRLSRTVCNPESGTPNLN
jgi:hypothetical protein